MFKNKQLNENLKAFVQNMFKTCRHCICFSSPGAMISKIAAHGMNYVVFASILKTTTKGKIIASYEVRLSLALSNFSVACTYIHASVYWVAM